MNDSNNIDIISFRKKIKKHVVRMTNHTRASHIGSNFSIADIIAVLYSKALKINPDEPNWQARDIFILSKGHAAAIVYAALAERGFFPSNWLDSYCDNNSKLSGHITNTVPGVEVSTGSLGHGLPIACGMALSAKHDSIDKKYIFTILSDGEMDEGTTWESALFAAHNNLNNIILFIDYNKIQSFGYKKQVINIESLIDKWQSFNWHAQEINGHDHSQILSAIDTAKNNKTSPSVIIAHTIKGKGVSFMEDKLAWHYKSPSDTEMDIALKELDLEI